MNNSLDKQYLNLLQDILDNGHVKGDRTGTGTISVFGRTIRHKMSEGFPLLTTKEMHWPSIVNELLWFISGSDDIRDLWKRNVRIWDGDWYKNYKNSCSSPYELKEIKQKVKDGDTSFPDDMFSLGPIYGKQWRKWKSHKTEYLKAANGPGIEANLQIDQLENVMEALKTNPDSRRMMVSAWNVAEIDDMTLPPCHYGFQVYTRELTLEERFTYWFHKKEPNRTVVDELENSPEEHQHNYFDKVGIPKRELSLKWDQRSVDVPLGLPFNIASYGVLLLMLADEMNMVPGELIGYLGDTHIYMNQIDGVKEQLKREPYELPTVFIRDGMYSCSLGDILLENYKSHGKIKFPLSN